MAASLPYTAEIKGSFQTAPFPVSWRFNSHSNLLCLHFFCPLSSSSIVTFFLAYSKRNIMTQSYMQISFSFQCVLGRGGNDRGDSWGRKKAIYWKELLYCTVILVFQEKGMSSHRKLCRLRLFESAVFFVCCRGQWSL